MAKSKHALCIECPQHVSDNYLNVWFSVWPSPNIASHTGSLSVLPEVIHSLSFTVQWLLQHRQALQTCETKTCRLFWNYDTVTDCTNQKLIMTERGIKNCAGTAGRRQGREVLDTLKVMTSPAGVMWNVKPLQRCKGCQSGHNIKIFLWELNIDPCRHYSDRAKRALFFTSHDKEQMEQCCTTIWFTVPSPQGWKSTIFILADS